MQKMDSGKRKAGNKSYYKTYLTSFLLIFLIPTFFLTILSIMSQRTIRGQIQEESGNVLYQFFQRIDGAVKNAWDDSEQIIFDNNMRGYSKKIVSDFSYRAYSAWQLSRLLQNYTGSQYQDIFVYFPAKDYIVSAQHGAALLEHYYLTNYARGSDDFLTEFREVADSSFRKPSLCSMDRGSNDPYVCLAMRYRHQEKPEYDFVLVITFSREYISELLEDLDYSSQDGIFMLMDPDAQLLYCSAGPMEEYPAPMDEARPVKLGGKLCYTQTMESDVVDIRYVYAVPRDYYWDRLKYIYSVYLFWIVVMIALGITAVLRFAKRTYQPLEKVVERLQTQDNIRYDGCEATEFEFIEELFEKRTKESAALMLTIRQDQRAKRDHFIYSLLRGNSHFSGKVKHVFGENGVPLCSDLFCVAVCQSVKHSDKEDAKSQISAALVSRTEELCGPIGYAHMIFLRDVRYALLVNLKRRVDSEALPSILERVIDFFAEQYQYELTFGVSTVREGMQGIPAAYEEAVLAQKYSYLQGTGTVIEYVQVANKEFTYPQTAELKMLHMITRYLKGDGSTAAELAGEIFSQYGISPSVSLETIDCFRFEALSVFHRLLSQKNWWMPEWKEQVQALLGASSLDNFKQMFTSILERLYYKNRETDDGEDICSLCQKFIKEHYWEEQLTLTLLGEQFGMDPSYLSKQFKRKYQLTIPEFISRVRVDHAKELLRGTVQNIQEISANCGFVSSNSFIRTFKRWEGITPGAYRDFIESNVSK